MSVATARGWSHPRYFSGISGKKKREKKEEKKRSRSVKVANEP